MSSRECVSAQSLSTERSPLTLQDTVASTAEEEKSLIALSTSGDMSELVTDDDVSESYVYKSLVVGETSESGENDFTESDADEEEDKEDNKEEEDTSGLDLEEEDEEKSGLDLDDDDDDKSVSDECSSPLPDSSDHSNSISHEMSSSRRSDSPASVSSYNSKIFELPVGGRCDSITSLSDANTDEEEQLEEENISVEEEEEADKGDNIADVPEAAEIAPKVVSPKVSQDKANIVGTLSEDVADLKVSSKTFKKHSVSSNLSAFTVTNDDSQVMQTGEMHLHSSNVVPPTVEVVSQQPTKKVLSNSNFNFEGGVLKVEAKPFHSSKAHNVRPPLISKEPSLPYRYPQQQAPPPPPPAAVATSSTYAPAYVGSTDQTGVPLKWYNVSWTSQASWAGQYNPVNTQSAPSYRGGNPYGGGPPPAQPSHQWQNSSQYYPQYSSRSTGGYDSATGYRMFTPNQFSAEQFEQNSRYDRSSNYAQRNYAPPSQLNQQSNSHAGYDKGNHSRSNYHSNGQRTFERSTQSQDHHPNQKQFTGQQDLRGQRSVTHDTNNYSSSNNSRTSSTSNRTNTCTVANGGGATGANGPRVSSYVRKWMANESSSSGFSGPQKNDPQNDSMDRSNQSNRGSGGHAVPTGDHSGSSLISRQTGQQQWYEFQDLSSSGPSGKAGGHNLNGDYRLDSRSARESNSRGNRGGGGGRFNNSNLGGNFGNRARDGPRDAPRDGFRDDPRDSFRDGPRDGPRDGISRFDDRFSGQRGGVGRGQEQTREREQHQARPPANQYHPGSFDGSARGRSKQWQ